MQIRSFSGNVVLPDGTGVLVGYYRITPIGNLPADADGVRTRKSMIFPITDGAVSGTILTPGNYKGDVLADGAVIDSFIFGVTETSPDPLNVLAMYSASMVADAKEN
ncbi:MAG TPA: hypothetical protein PKL48_10415 [Thermodesulfobacteriota bacterium]|nr:hypothetical protein [Thermodesulfobacteriota bacterium]